MPKKVVKEEVGVEGFVFDEKAALLTRYEALMLIRSQMTANGIDCIGKLDVMLSQVNQRLKELS